MLKPIHTFSVVPKLPSSLEALRTIAYNLRWCWSHESVELFRRLDRDLWESSGHNPVLLLGTIEQSKLEEAAKDDAFLAHLQRVESNLEAYLPAQGSWFCRTHGCDRERPTIAYFSAEFGLTECLSIFAGGLGILAGDHLKSASDLGVPLVGIGLLYQQGYFRQYLSQSGWQQEAYIENDFHNLPLTQVYSNDGKLLTVEVSLAGRAVKAQVWKVQVGRVPLYLLDTNIDANSRPEDRDITDQLYGGDREMRIRQEILLGIGGYRALQALGIQPTVCHMNEGHSAFLALEHILYLMRTCHLNLAEARELAAAGLVFTTHTPVEAGHDYFDRELVNCYFGDTARELGISLDEFFELGRAPHRNDFCTAVLALRSAGRANGVAKLHGEVSRKMWQSLWPGVPVDEIPIGHVTNGVHFRSWISSEFNHLYDRYLGPNWRDEPANSDVWDRVRSIPAEELWRTHERRRERLVAWARRRVRDQRIFRAATQAEIDAADEVLDPDTLTIGFARRFATYKRATLILRDMDRFRRIVMDSARPVQFIFAGKAHPQDDLGKELIRKITEVSRDPVLGRHVVFLENYDLAVARYLVQGVDVWLNTPRRPWEACGTSGMKVLVNGGLNLSSLDGWWAEAYAPGLGWSIDGASDAADAEAIFRILEKEVVPLFYDRDAEGLPRAWIERVRASLAKLTPKFSGARMVAEYDERYYRPARLEVARRLADGAGVARALDAWATRIATHGPGLRLGHLEVRPRDAGAEIAVEVYLDDLAPRDVAVELYADPPTPGDPPTRVPMTSAAPLPGSAHGFLYTAVVGGERPASAYTARIVPASANAAVPLELPFVIWHH